MRDDMSKVIVDRPRGRAWSRRGRIVPTEHLPKQQGMRRPYRLAGDWKLLNENLSPLRRYLERQVGRPWDKVYSEICRNLRTDNAVQQHVRDHLSDFVAVKPRRWSGWHYRPDGSRKRFNRLWVQPLYVDPRDGLLKRTDRLGEARQEARTQTASKRPMERIAVAADRELRLIHGVWYELLLAPLPQPEYRNVQQTYRMSLNPYVPSSTKVAKVCVYVRRLVTPALRDVADGHAVYAGPLLDDEPSWRDYRRNHPDRRYAVAKRTLSKAELKRHRLHNST